MMIDLGPMRAIKFEVEEPMEEMRLEDVSMVEVSERFLFDSLDEGPSEQRAEDGRMDDLVEGGQVTVVRISLDQRLVQVLIQLEEFVERVIGLEECFSSQIS
jgi:hypothetical protein